MHVYVAVLQPCTEGMIKNLTWSWRNVQRLCQLDSSLQIQPSSLVHSQQGRTLHSHPKDIIHQDSAVPLTANVSGLHVVSKAVPYSHAKDIIHQDSAVPLTANVCGPQSARPYPTQSCQRYYTPRQCSLSYSHLVYSQQGCTLHSHTKRIIH